MNFGAPASGPGLARPVPDRPGAADAGHRRMCLVLALIAWVTGCGRPPGQLQGPTAEVGGAPLVLPEHYAVSLAALGMPGAQRSFQVGHGSVIGNGDAALEWRIASGEGPVTVSPVYFERDGVPVAHWWMTTARESVHFEAATVASEALGDTSLLLSVRATATWLAETPGECVLEVRLRLRADGPAAIPWDVGNTDTFEEQWRDRFAIRNGCLVAGVDAALARAPQGTHTTRGPGPGALIATGRARLARGERQEWHYWMPAYPSTARGEMLERLAAHDAVVGEARRFWRGRLAHGSTLATPDSLVDAAYRAACVTLLLCQERRGDAWVPIGNPFQYRDVWIRDGARVVRALLVAGHTDVARSDAWTLTGFQLPSGVLISQRGQLDGTGQALWALAQAATLPVSREWAARTLPVVRSALEWIGAECLLTRQLVTRYPGLLPYGDPRDNELTRAQLTGNDAWGIAGCRAAATLARLAGDTPLAAFADSLTAAYLGAFRAALARSGSRDVPPSWQGPGRDFGNLAAAYPTRVMAPEDPRLAALAHRVWGSAGGPGLASHAPLDSLHSYLASDLAQWALLAGRPSEARAYLAALLEHSSSTLGQAELFARGDHGFGINLPPHATAAAVLVDLVRNMIVSDTRDTLEIALGGDASWWRGTRFERAVTRFGAMDVAIDSPAPDRRRARWGVIDAPARVRVADGERAVEALTPGARIVAGRWIECPPRSGAVEFRVAASPAAAGGPAR
jgi:hypothetical protein